MRGLSALRPRLSDPVAEVLYFIMQEKVKWIAISFPQRI